MESQTIDYESLVRKDRVDSTIYTSEEIFAAEMERIFHRWWIYVAHESELAEPGDYKTSWIGTQPVLVPRDREGAIHVLLNRCRHRGNTVCEDEHGNSMFFRCQYHGWTYSNNGDLVGVSIPTGYDNDFQKSDYGLVRAAEIETYRGFIFAKLMPEGIPFEEYISPVRAMIDMFCDLSPVGEVDLCVGAQKGYYNGNWKLLGMDGYHPPFVHRSVNDALQRKERYQGIERGEFGSTTHDDSGSLVHDMGHGHVRVNSWPSRIRNADRYVGPFQETSWGRQYLHDLEARHGEERAHELIACQNPHTGIWPSLQLIDVHVRQVRPVSASRTEVSMAPAFLKGVPAEVNRQRLRQHEFGFGPASFVSSDDYEIFERNQLGFQATVERDCLLARGLHRQYRDPNGDLVAMHSDETTQRAQLNEWRYAMSLADGER